VRRFGALAELNDADRNLLLSLPPWTQHHGPEEAFLDRQSLKERPHIVVEGWACRMQPVGHGKRQIIAFILPGDVVGMCEHIDPIERSQIVALTQMTTLDASPLKGIQDGDHQQHVGLREALRRVAELQRAALMNQLLRLGRHSAYDRLAHLLLEVADRLSLAGFDERFPFPLTQHHLADALGLSSVHVSRTFKQLNDEGHWRLKHGFAELLKRAELANRVSYRSCSFR
jgi:CRP-like cAMP-binding protein